MLTVKESLADSGRSSKTSGSSGRRVKDREEREEREERDVQQQLVAASPSELLQETAVSLSQQQALSHQQYGWTSWGMFNIPKKIPRKFECKA